MALKDIDVTVLSTVLDDLSTNSDVQLLLSQLSGEPVLLESREGKQAISLDFLKKFLPYIQDFLPLIPLFLTGGFSPQLIIAVLPILAKIFGISQEAALASFKTALELREQQA